MKIKAGDDTVTIDVEDGRVLVLTREQAETMAYQLLVATTPPPVLHPSTD